MPSLNNITALGLCESAICWGDIASIVAITCSDSSAFVQSVALINTIVMCSCSLAQLDWDAHLHRDHPAHYVSI